MTSTAKATAPRLAPGRGRGSSARRRVVISTPDPADPEVVGAGAVRRSLLRVENRRHAYYYE